MPDKNADKHRPEGYATNSITEKTSTAAKKVGGKTVKETKRLAKKGYDKVREQHKVKQKDKYGKNYKTDTKKEQADDGKRSSAKTRHAEEKSSNKSKSILHTGNKTNKSVKSSDKTVKTEIEL